MPKVIEKLKQEHAEFRRFLKIFDDELDKFRDGRTPNYEMIDALLDFFTSFPDEWHHKKEDVVYDVLAARMGSFEKSLTDLRSEHSRLETGAKAFGERIAHLRGGGELAIQNILGPGETYSRLLRHHMVKEDQVFFPLAEQHLTHDDWQSIEAEISSLRESPTQQAKMDRVRRVAHSILEIAAE